MSELIRGPPRQARMNQALVDTIVDLMREAAQNALHPQALSPWESGAERIIEEVQAAIADETAERFKEAVQEALSVSWKPLKVAPEPDLRDARECSQCSAPIWEEEDPVSEDGLCDECRPDEDGVRPRDCQCEGGMDVLSDPPIICAAHLTAWRLQRTRDALVEGAVEMPSWP